MLKNFVFDIGGVLAEEVNGRALKHLSSEEQTKISDLAYYKSSGFIKALMGEQTIAEYAVKLASEHPQLANEIHYLFDPQNLPITYPVRKEVLAALRSLHRSHRVFFLSNMIDISYDYLKDILDEFDGGVYSFLEHAMKPDPAFYQILLERYQLNPAETIFFDDIEKNVLAAQKVGMQAVVFKDIDSIKPFLK